MDKNMDLRIVLMPPKITGWMWTEYDQLIDIKIQSLRTLLQRKKGMLRMGDDQR